MGDWPNETKLSALHIRRACEASLRRMHTDYIDLYQMHHVDRDTPWDEIWQAMDLLVQQGKVLYVGSSNFAGWHIVQANEAARRRGSLGLVSEQSLYNLIERTIELEVLPACRDYGVGVIPWSPLAGGMLGGILRKAREGRSASDQARKRLEEHQDQVEEYEAFCDELGERPADVALAWLLHQPGVTAPIIGPRTLEQLEHSLRALEVELDDRRWPASTRSGPAGRPRPRGVRVVRTEPVSWDVGRVRALYPALADGYAYLDGPPAPRCRPWWWRPSPAPTGPGSATWAAPSRPAAARTSSSPSAGGPWPTWSAASPTGSSSART